MAISDEVISKIKSLSVSAVLEQEKVYLKKVGREFVTHCLWHDDKNPSLTVSDEKGFVFCHACREGGDAIHFIQKKFGLSFREACERIAANNNIQVIYIEENDQYNAEKKEELRRMLEAVKIAQDNYRSDLRASALAVDFLKSRGIRPETSRDFGLGYNQAENRLTIPIKNYKGEIVGFTGRAIGDEKPKYKNTENNIIFNKSDLVFNEYDASDWVRKSGECIFVEGHIDVISMWQAGIKNVVAIQGTASPSERIITRLKRKANRFVLCMDTDEAGEKAVGLFLNSIKDQALSGEIDIKIASIPKGKDPDEAISLGVAMEDVIANALPWLDWILDQWLNKLDFSNTTQIQEVEKRVKDLIGGISSAALRAHYFDKAATRLAQNKQNIAATILKNLQTNAPQPSSGRTWKKPTIEWTRALVEKRFMRLYIHKPGMRIYLKPLADRLVHPDLVWLWNRVQELEESSYVDCTPYSVMAILAVAEPRFANALRPIARPSIKVDDSPGVLLHIEDVLMSVPKEDEGTLF